MPRPNTRSRKNHPSPAFAQVGGHKCVLTVKRRDDESGFHISVFHPASELQHDLFLTPEELQDALPEELLGEENELEQLHFIRDKYAPPPPCPSLSPPVLSAALALPSMLPPPAAPPSALAPLS